MFFSSKTFIHSMHSMHSMNCALKENNLGHAQEIWNSMESSEFFEIFFKRNDSSLLRRLKNDVFSRDSQAMVLQYFDIIQSFVNCIIENVSPPPGEAKKNKGFKGIESYLFEPVPSEDPNYALLRSAIKSACETHKSPIFERVFNPARFLNLMIDWNCFELYAGFSMPADTYHLEVDGQKNTFLARVLMSRDPSRELVCYLINQFGPTDKAKNGNSLLFEVIEGLSRRRITYNTSIFDFLRIFDVTPPQRCQPNRLILMEAMQALSPDDKKSLTDTAIAKGGDVNSDFLRSISNNSIWGGGMRDIFNPTSSSVKKAR